MTIVTMEEPEIINTTVIVTIAFTATTAEKEVPNDSIANEISGNSNNGAVSSNAASNTHVVAATAAAAAYLKKDQHKYLLHHSSYGLPHNSIISSIMT